MRYTNGTINVSIASDGTIYLDGKIWMQCTSEEEAREWLEDHDFLPR